MTSSSETVRVYTVRALPAGTVEDIQVLAARHHISQAQVIEEAVWHFQVELGKRIPLPDGWRKPRDW